MKHTVNKMTSHFVRRIFARITTPKVSQVSSSLPPSSSFGFVYDYLHVILAHVNYPITQHHHHLLALTVWQKANPASYQIYPISAILCTQLDSGGERKKFFLLLWSWRVCVHWNRAKKCWKSYTLFREWRLLSPTVLHCKITRFLSVLF